MPSAAFGDSRLLLYAQPRPQTLRSHADNSLSMSCPGLYKRITFVVVGRGEAGALADLLRVQQAGRATTTILAFALGRAGFAHRKGASYRSTDILRRRRSLFTLFTRRARLTYILNKREISSFPLVSVTIRGSSLRQPSSVICDSSEGERRLAVS